MSAQEVIAAHMLAGHVSHPDYDANPYADQEGPFIATPLCRCGRQVEDYPAHLLDALRAGGSAVVELPEPTDTYSHLTEMSMMGWEVGHGPVFAEALPGKPPTVRVEVDGETVAEVSPSYAAQFAAALLAAADAADRAGDDGEGR